ncbi:MAG: argininosuccinate synthase [Sulfurospirillum sp.]|nr:argininosuccinate synthase [Sulfurospirillum sp.]
MKALALFSGGLDSMLAMKLLSDQGIEVIALHVDIGFNSKKEAHLSLTKRAQMAGARLEVVDVHDEYLQEVLFNPRYGYGKQFNPCIDCHGYMFRLAKTLLPTYGASFIITGEVVGQRPMSQTKEALRNVKRLADDLDENLILRPLSAKLMEETTPEKEGWVDRARLLDFNGRGRSRQLELAKSFGWEDYPTPAGGCLLTDIQFSARIKDLLAHETFETSDTLILKNGRHFRLENGAKLVLGRNEHENDFLERVQSSKYLSLHVKELNAPSGLLSATASEEERMEACKILLSYTKANDTEFYNIDVGETSIHACAYPSRDKAKKYLI